MTENNVANMISFTITTKIEQEGTDFVVYDEVAHESGQPHKIRRFAGTEEAARDYAAKLGDYWNDTLNSRTGPQRGSPRVTAWIHSVLNPFIDALREEIAFLRNGELTWRFYNRQFELIRPLQEYIIPTAWRTLDDFLRARPKMAPLLGEHDEARANLERLAGEAFASLIARAEFTQLVMTKLTEYQVGRQPQNANPSGAWPPDTLPSLVAERVINLSPKDVGYRYSDREFWMCFYDLFMAMGTTREIASLRTESHQFLVLVERVMKSFAGEHYFLCDAYDVPPAPLE